MEISVDVEIDCPKSKLMYLINKGKMIMAISNCKRIKAMFIAFVLCANFSADLLAQDVLSELAEEEKLLKLENSIEKLKATIAETKRGARESEVLFDLEIRKKEAEARKSEAEAKKGEALAAILPTKIEPLKGTLDVKDFGVAGFVIAVDIARKMSKKVCESLPVTEKTFIYDEVAASGVISARMLKTQLDLYAKSLSDAVEGPNDEGLSKGVMAGLAMDAAVATGSIKAFADLASLFKTNVSVSKTTFDKTKSLFITSMVKNCPDKIASIGSGYIGELDPTSLDKLRSKAFDILESRTKLETKILELKGRVEKEKDKVKKKLLQSQLNDFLVVAKQVDGFLKILKPHNVSATSPLLVAAKHLALSSRIKNVNVMELDIALEGLSIVKENIFTGQKLRLSATAIIWYRIFKIDGLLVKADVLRHMAKPIQVDLRGNSPNDDFWDENY